MPQTSTRYISFQTLEGRGQSAVTVIKLMMACNDLSFANEALGEWKNEQPRHKQGRQTAAKMYFVRTQLGHLHEGLKAIAEIRADELLMGVVRRCDQTTQQSFAELERFLVDDAHRHEFEQLIGRVRHSLTFHYDENGKQIKKAIADRAARQESRLSSITRGNTAHLWHFKVAEDVLDSIVVRQIWKIPRDADVRSEVDKVADRVQQILLWFVDFSGEFVWRYAES